MRYHPHGLLDGLANPSGRAGPDPKGRDGAYLGLMTPEQRAIVIEQVVVPGRPVPTPESQQQSLREAFRTDDGRELGELLLVEAEDRRSSEDVELALIVADIFGMDGSVLPVLKRLARASWHSRHEDICRDLTEAGGRDDVVDELEFLATAGPEFVNYPGDSALARHAVHGLEKVATPRARAALQRLRAHPEPEVRSLVERVERRTPPLPE